MARNAASCNSFWNVFLNSSNHLTLPAHGLPVKGTLARRLKTREAGSTSALKTAAGR